MKSEVEQILISSIWAWPANKTKQKWSNTFCRIIVNYIKHHYQSIFDDCAQAAFWHVVKKCFNPKGISWEKFRPVALQVFLSIIVCFHRYHFHKAELQTNLFLELRKSVPNDGHNYTAGSVICQEFSKQPQQLYCISWWLSFVRGNAHWAL